MINIHGGNITATGNQYGAGIGGGDGHGFGQQANNSGLHHVFIEEHNDDESDDDDAGE